MKAEYPLTLAIQKIPYHTDPNKWIRKEMGCGKNFLYGFAKRLELGGIGSAEGQVRPYKVRSLIATTDAMCIECGLSVNPVRELLQPLLDKYEKQRAREKRDAERMGKRKGKRFGRKLKPDRRSVSKKKR